MAHRSSCHNRLTLRVNRRVSIDGSVQTKSSTHADSSPEPEATDLGVAVTRGQFHLPTIQDYHPLTKLPTKIMDGDSWHGSNDADSKDERYSETDAQEELPPHASQRSTSVQDMYKSVSLKAEQEFKNDPITQAKIQKQLELTSKKRARLLMQVSQGDPLNFIHSRLSEVHQMGHRAENRKAVKNLPQHILENIEVRYI